MLFYLSFKQIKNRDHMMFNLFNKYADSLGYKAILGDSFMVFICILFYLLTIDLKGHIILIIFLVYLLPYLVYK